MNKKILIGSIISIIILVGVSFTSVVGYNNIESNIGVSPLFNIRSSRAIDEDNKILTSDYVGKGDDFNILIPNIDSESELIQKVIDIIIEMDEDEFEFFINIILQKVSNIKFDIDNEQIKGLFNLIRNHNKEYNIILYDNISNNNYKGFTKRLTCFYPIYYCDFMRIRYILKMIVDYIVMLGLIFFTFIFNCEEIFSQ